MGEVETMVQSLDQQKETLKAVQSGNAPPSPDLPPAKVDMTEPQVSVVEVGDIYRGLGFFVSLCFVFV